MKKLQAAVVGLGNAGAAAGKRPKREAAYSHVHACLSHRGLELAALCDPGEERRRAAGLLASRARLYGDAAEMLDRERIDLLCVAAPTSGHAPIVRLAVESGVRKIFCEKPLADTLDAAREMVDLCADNRVRMAVNYHRRWDPLVGDLRRAIRNGALGSIQQISLGYCAGIVHDATHLIDLTRYLVGEFAWVRGEFRGNEPSNSLEPNVNGMFGLESGAFGSLCAYDRAAHNLFEIDVTGTRGRFRSVDHLGTFDFFQARPEAFYEGDNFLVLDSRLSAPAPGGTALQAALSELINDKGPSPRCVAVDGWRAMQIAHAFWRSADEGGTKIWIDG